MTGDWPQWEVNPPAETQVDDVESAAGELTDVRVNNLTPVRIIIVGLGLIVATIVVGLGCLHLLGLAGSSAMVLLWLCVVLGCLVWGATGSWRLSRMVARNADRDLAFLVTRAHSRYNWLGAAGQWQRSFVRALCRTGRTGATIRLYLGKPSSPIEPLEVGFEPRPLDEADGAFAELRRAMDSPASPSAPVRHRGQPSIAQRIRRNVRLRSGWWLVIVLTILAAYQVLASIRLGTPTFGLFFWVALLAIVLFLPSRSTTRATRQWFILPGGLCVRRSPALFGALQVRLFDRRSGALLVHQQNNRKWKLAVADVHASEVVELTTAEVEFALRAWLSPLRPPAADELTDLA